MRKTLKFRPHLVEEIRAGRKDVTWRLFDDKDLAAGDLLELVDWETGETFAEAEATSVHEKTLGEVADADFDGHEKYSSREEMLAHYREYYGDRVTFETPIKMIAFTVTRFL